MTMAFSKTEKKLNNVIELKDPTRLKLVLQAMDTLNDETNINIDENGIIIRGMPANHVSLMDVFIPAGVFSVFDTQPFQFRIKVANLVKLISRAKSTDTLTISILEHRLLILIKSDYTKQYELSVMQFNKDEDKLPKVTFPVIINTDALFFKDLVDDIALVSEFFIVKIQPDKSIDLGGQDDLRGVHLGFFNDEQLMITECNTNTEIRSKFKIDIFMRLASVFKGLDRMIIELGDSMPMRLTYSIPDFASITVFIAPLQGGDQPNE